MLQKNQEAVQTFVQTERLDSGVMPSNQLNVLQDNVNFIQSQNLFTEQEILEKNNTRLNAKESQETEICVEGDQKNTERQFTSIESIRQNNKQGQSWKEFNFNMNTNWFQRIFFVDLLRLLFHCKKSVKSKTEMHLNDIPHLFPDEQICQIGKRFEIYTENEKNRLNKKGREIGALSMLKIFVLTYKHQFFMEFFYIFLLNAFKIASTICIANLINDIANSEPKQKQYMWASIIAVSNFLQVLCLHHSNKINYTLFSSIRVMFMKTLYQKISNLSAHTIKETNVGKLVNIVSSDLTTIEIKSFLIISLTMIPFGLIAVAAVLYFRFGSFGVLGLLLMTCFIPIQIFAAEKSSKIFAQKTSLIDKRINLTSELIEGIRLIKMYAWEGAFKKAIVEVRNLELKKVFKILLYFVFEHSLSQATGILVTYFILALIQGFGDTNQLTIGSMFATLDLLQYTRSKMISVAGYGLSGALELKVVFQRMANVLKIKQTQMSSIDGENEYQKETTQKGELILNHFSAYWRGDQAVLKDINLHIKQGECVSIVGKIGSGKSTLLNCFLQEVPKFKGNFSYNGKLAYVEQEPYIFNCSVRENIIFGKQFKESFYNSVVQTCNLLDDFKLFTNGDLTEIGERGLNISGGQKARISLARALYSEADIYLLDDPLSAVDSKVAKSMFYGVIKEFLKNKTVILVTHQIHFTKDSDRIIILNEGQISDQGTYKQLEAQLKELSYNNQLNESLVKSSSLQNNEKYIQQTNLNKEIQIRDISLENLTKENQFYFKSELNQEGGISQSKQNKINEKSVQRDKQIEEVNQNKEDFQEKQKINYQEQINQLEEQQLEIDGKNKIEKSNNNFKDICENTNIKQNNLQKEILNSNPDLKIKEKQQSQKQTESQYTQESSENITVSLQTYWKYISSSKYLLIIPILIILFFTSEVLTTVFTNAIGQYGSESYSKQSIVNFLGFLTLAYTINLIIKYYMLIKVESSSSQNLHDKMIESLVKSKVEYFEKTQSGRILNRYSTDLVIVDQSLPLTSIDSLEVLCSHVVMLIMLIVINPYFLIVAFIMILMLYYFLVISKICLIQSKQTDLRNRSPVFNYFTATMQGILPLRVYGQTKQFQEKFNQLSDSSLRSSYCYWHITRAFGAYVHIFSSLAGIIGIYMLIFIGKSGSQVGQSIVYFLSMSDIIQWGLRQIIQTDVTMSSTQRILNMCQLESESDLITAYDQKFLKNNLITKQTDQGVVLQEQKFPQEGKVEFINVRMRYRKGQDPILNQLSFTINPGMRVGCVGRTGAGKSSLIAALFRMTEIDEPENQNEEIAIKLDGHIAKQLGLHTLRSGISLIPQIPFIFSGTILRNIDPLGEYTENEIKKVIDDVGLQDKIEELPNGLDTDMTNASEIFSVGQKQLICLARAILKKSKLLILDEATANVDMITDDLIQRKIKERFQGSTVITVAHRLNTIADYDMVIVMDKGRVIEQGDPYDLLSKEQSHFKDMVNQTGKNNSKNIYDIAKQAHLLRKNQELYF